MSEAPPFWFQPRGIAAWLLAPLSLIYGSLAGYRMGRKAGHVSSAPVFCIGNFVVGGAGKTPTAIAIAALARKRGLTVGFLSRGYGGQIAQPALVDIDRHNARDVGDEPLLLARHAPTVVSADRPAGADMLESVGVDFIIMDDGFQNPSLHKDFSLAVIDARRGIGNGFAFPAGPLRADMRTQLRAMSALLVVGAGEAGSGIVRKAARMARPVVNATVAPKPDLSWSGQKVFAYSGIADAEKFHTSLVQAGAEIADSRDFGDHHIYSIEDCHTLLDQQGDDIVLATTAKDAARLRGMGNMQQRLVEASRVLEVELAFENPRMIEMFIEKTISQARDFRLRKRR